MGASLQRKLFLVSPSDEHVTAYRGHTAALLRRYFQMSTECGRIPSGTRIRDTHARVSSYRMHTFEDAIIFVHDVERCLSRLSPNALEALAAFALLGMETEEAADALDLSVAQALRRYGSALDQLSRELLRTELMSCRFGEHELAVPQHSDSPVQIATAAANSSMTHNSVPSKPPARATLRTGATVLQMPQRRT